MGRGGKYFIRNFKTTLELKYYNKILLLLNLHYKRLFYSLFEQTLPGGKSIPLPPVLIGVLGKDPKKPTVVLYGHLDVQPAAKEDGWATEPFKLVVKDGKMYGRGSTDDKGPVLGWMHAIEAYQSTKNEIPVNIKVRSMTCNNYYDYYYTLICTISNIKHHL